MPPFETIETDSTIVACNGDGGPLGHPRVFLNLAPAGRVECPYCSRLFVNPRAAEPGAAAAGHAGTATPSARGPGPAREDESPPPRQSPA